MAKLHVLVTGATGKQGGAVARRLIERGHRVRALTRDPASPAAIALAGIGVDVAMGSLEDRGSIARALAGADALFAMSTPYEAGVAAEMRQGIDAADAAKAAGVHLVYTSVGNADTGTGIPHFDSKAEVERHIRSIGVDATILAPVYFMENVGFIRDQLRKGIYASPMSPGRKLMQIAVGDIAAAAVTAFEDRRQFIGKRYDLAGDELTGNETVDILSRAIGRRMSYFQLPLDAVRGAMGEDGVKMYQWFETTGYRVDRDAHRREFPEVPWLSFEAWARSQDWNAFFAA
ncbi:MAG TPA: NmrA/HSCARG family protein [Haliangiales bacterium]|nr:NmrA/HSCARG family protein [Haliangiales bacterium]